MIIGVAFIFFPIWLAFVASTVDQQAIVRPPMPLLPGDKLVENYTRALTSGVNAPVGMLLPMFVGEAYKDLQRLSDPIENLQTERWLVMHQDERHEPAVRQALGALAKLLKKDPMLRTEF